jgi:diguanylate cyclase (GGDEF)-like protein
MGILSVDIRTVIFLLWMGNLIVVALFAIYNHSQSQKNSATLFFRARLVQTIGWILIWLRDLIPDAFSVMAANNLLFVGWALEALAIISIRPRRQRFDIIYAVAALLSVPANIAIYQLSSNHGNDIASLVPLILFILPALILSFERNASALQRVFGGLYLTYCVTTGFRAVAALTSSITFTLLTPGTSQTFAFLSLFWLMMFGAIGYLLLFKEKADQELLLAATIDPLTGILNRRSFFKNAETSIVFAIRNNDPVALLTLDIDGFKCINDTFGHPVGDLVLRDFTAAALKFVRPYDVFGRIGGDEFVILLPKTSSTEALSVAKRIQTMVEDRRLKEKPLLQYTVSIGVCSQIPQTIDDLSKMVQTSDEVLFGAKSNGRNRVIAVVTRKADMCSTTNTYERHF